MSINNVTSLEVTYAIRDSQIDDLIIKQNDFLGFINHKMTTVSKSKLDSIKDLFNTLEDIEEKEVVSILYGSDVTEEEISEVLEYLESTYDWLEVAPIYGGQKVYSFIIAVE